MEIPKQQRVAVYHSNTNIEVTARVTPFIQDDELLLRVHASGICGSDVMEWYRRPRAPTVLGHEVAGEVVAVGAGVENVGVGDRVVATHHVPCLICDYCRSGRETACETLRRTSFDPGGFAEFVRVPAVNVVRGVLPLPPHVSDDAGSFVEPLACVVRSQRRANLAPRQTVLIIGAGISGTLHLLAAKAAGAAVVFVSEVLPSRCDIARRLGAEAVFTVGDDVPARLRERLGRGVDHVVMCTGAPPAIATGLASVDRGGTVSFFAPMKPDEIYPLPFNEVFWQNGVTLTSSYGAGPDDLHQALALIADGQVDVTPLITHRLPLEKIQEGFAMMLDGRSSMKIIIDPRMSAR